MNGDAKRNTTWTNRQLKKRYVNSTQIDKKTDMEITISKYLYI